MANCDCVLSKIGRMTEDGLVDADAIAVLLNIPRDTVLDLARRQLIPSYRFSRKLIRFDKAEVCATADDKLKINTRGGRRPRDRYPFL